MRGKTPLFMVFALGAGLLAMVGANRFLGRGNKTAAVEMVDVVVASHDLAMEELLKPEVLKVVSIAKASVPAGAFRSLDQVVGRWVKVKMFEGEAVLDAKLAPKGAPQGLVAMIPPGMRALAVDVNETSGVSGFILPNHHVDVILTRIAPSGQIAQAEVILQDVLVLASGQTLSRTEDKSITAKTVTLALTPDQASSLAAARTRGSLSLSLRGLDDHARMPQPEPIVAVEPTPAPLPVIVPTPLPTTPLVAATDTEESEEAPEPPPTRVLRIFRGLAPVQEIVLPGPTAPRPAKTGPRARGPVAERNATPIRPG